MELIEIKLSEISSVKSLFYTNVENTLLVANFSGVYKHGSAGNLDGNYMLSILAAHYFLLEPLVILVDLSSLNYEWGNTILSTINFFNEIGREKEETEKTMIIVTSSLNKNQIESLSKTPKSNRFFFDDFSSALNFSCEKIAKLLED